MTNGHKPKAMESKGSKTCLSSREMKHNNVSYRREVNTLKKQWPALQIQIEHPEYS
jgi:hypothetical protein